LPDVIKMKDTLLSV